MYFFTVRSSIGQFKIGTQRNERNAAGQEPIYLSYTPLNINSIQTKYLTFLRFHYFHLLVACKNFWTTGNLEIFLVSSEHLHSSSERLLARAFQSVFQSLPWFDGSCVVWPGDKLYHQTFGPQQNWNFYDFHKNVGRNSLSSVQPVGFPLQGTCSILLAWTRIYTICFDSLKSCCKGIPNEIFLWIRLPMSAIVTGWSLSSFYKKVSKIPISSAINNKNLT